MRLYMQEWRSITGGGDCIAVVEEMEQTGLLLREGIANTLWLTLNNSHNWLVHTQYLSR